MLPPKTVYGHSLSPIDAERRRSELESFLFQLLRRFDVRSSSILLDFIQAPAAVAGVLRSYVELSCQLIGELLSLASVVPDGTSRRITSASFATATLPAGSKVPLCAISWTTSEALVSRAASMLSLWEAPPRGGWCVLAAATAVDASDASLLTGSYDPLSPPAGMWSRVLLGSCKEGCVGVQLASVTVDTQPSVAPSACVSLTLLKDTGEVVTQPLTVDVADGRIVATQGQATSREVIKQGGGWLGRDSTLLPLSASAGGFVAAASLDGSVRVLRQTDGALVAGGSLERKLNGASITAVALDAGEGGEEGRGALWVGTSTGDLIIFEVALPSGQSRTPTAPRFLTAVRVCEDRPSPVVALHVSLPSTRASAPAFVPPLWAVGLADGRVILHSAETLARAESTVRLGCLCVSATITSLAVVGCAEPCPLPDGSPVGVLASASVLCAVVVVGAADGTVAHYRASDGALLAAARHHSSAVGQILELPWRSRESPPAPSEDTMESSFCAPPGAVTLTSPVLWASKAVLSVGADGRALLSRVPHPALCCSWPRDDFAGCLARGLLPPLNLDAAADERRGAGPAKKPGLRASPTDLRNDLRALAAQSSSRAARQNGVNAGLGDGAGSPRFEGETWGGIDASLSETIMRAARKT